MKPEPPVRLHIPVRIIVSSELCGLRQEDGSVGLRQRDGQAMEHRDGGQTADAQGPLPG